MTPTRSEVSGLTSAFLTWFATDVVPFCAGNEFVRSKIEITSQKKDQKLKEINNILLEEINPTLTKLKEERRAPEHAVLKELKEEMSKVVISGYSFSEADNDVVNELVNNKLIRFKGLEVAAVDKKNVVIDCPSTEVALDVAHS